MTGHGGGGGSRWKNSGCAQEASEGNSRIFSARLNLVWGGEEKEETVFIKLWSSIHAVL